MEYVLLGGLVLRLVDVQLDIVSVAVYLSCMHTNLNF